MNQDLTIYKKAKIRVRLHLLFYFLIYMALFALTFYLIRDELVANPVFFKMFMMISAGQLIIFFLLFVLLSFGNRWFRFLYWLFIPVLFGLLLVPVQFALGDLSHYLPYGIYLFFMVIKLMFSIQIGIYLFKNPFCKTFYTKSIEINDDDYDLNLKDQQPQQIIYEYDDDEPEIVLKPEEEAAPKPIPLTYPQIAFRFGICVYLSLIVFPAFCQIFSGLFMSMDMQSSFAAKEIFIHCIFSAFIWTIPVFYLYYNQPNSQRCIYICGAVEFILVFWYLYRLKSFMNLDAYSLRVFILFVILDLIRYVAIIYFLKPVFKKASE